MVEDDAPFVPRWTLRALRREWRWRRRSGASRWGGLPALAALVASLACFVRTFQLLGGLRPAEAEGLRAFGVSHGGVVGVGMSASAWLVTAMLLLGLAGYLAEMPWVPRVGLKPRRRADEGRRPHPAPAPSPASPAATAPRLPPGVRRPRAARVGEAADPTRSLLPGAESPVVAADATPRALVGVSAEARAPVVSAEEARGAFALSRLDALLARVGR
jgi:hypothetical protein